MNILYIGSSSDWHVDLWVNYFSDKHNVHLFSDKEDYLKNQPFKGVTVIEVEGWFSWAINSLKVKSHKVYQLNKLLFVKSYAKRVDECIGRFDIDIVHAHSLYYGYLASFIKSNVPVIFTPMGSDVILHAQKNKIHRYMAQKSFLRADIITGDSLLLQEKGYNVGAKRENNYVIQNGVDTSIFFPKNNSIAKKFGVRNNETLIFSPRGFTPLYNIDIIVESLYMLITNNYKVKCMFSYAFGNEYSKKIKRKIKKYGIEKNVIWLGYIDYKEMADYYNASDIVISIPSSDSSPKSVYEAMFCKKPVVVTDLEWSYELLDDAICLKRVPVKDAEESYKALAHLIDDEVYRKKLAENALIEANKYFSYANNMKMMERIMFDAVNGVDSD